VAKTSEFRTDQSFSSITTPFAVHQSMTDPVIAAKTHRCVIDVLKIPPILILCTGRQTTMVGYCTLYFCVITSVTWSFGAKCIRLNRTSVAARDLHRQGRARTWTAPHRLSCGTIRGHG